MRTILLMYDSLNKNFLPSYGDKMTIAPNFDRLAKKTMTMDSFYVGSLPCIPARRELHTGRYNFLHRSWGPLEPFDDSMPALLGENGIYTHLVSDHAHYWQEGGATYHTKYSSCEMVRGQEGDFWIGEVKGFEKNLDLHRQDSVNRSRMQNESEHPHFKTFSSGMQFLKDNVNEDQWFLHLEYFDPHEPYQVPDRFKAMYDAQNYKYDWPEYGPVDSKSNKKMEAQQNYRALVSMLDCYLGKVLDFMDAHDMWKDTLLIVNTDHGFMLGEHDYFAKNYMPTYEEIARTPLFLWHPNLGERNRRCHSLAQTIDIAPTILDYFKIEKPKDMLGKSMLPLLKDDRVIHDYILFGYFGKHVCITDGRYVYMRAGRADKQHLLYNYTVLPLHMFTPFSLVELKNANPELIYDFNFSKGVGLMKIPASDDTSPNNSCYQYSRHLEYGDLLFDLLTDPMQKTPIIDKEIEQRMQAAMVLLLKENEAPKELFERIDLIE